MTQPEIRRPMNPFQLFPTGEKDYYREQVPPLVATPIKTYSFTGQTRRSIMFYHYLNCVGLIPGGSSRSGVQIAQFAIDDLGVITQLVGSPNITGLIILGTAVVIDYVILGATITVQANMALIANDNLADVETLMKNIPIPVAPPPI